MPMNSSNLFPSLSEAIEESQKDEDTRITDDDINNLQSLEIPELNEFLNARILLAKQTKNPRARKVSRDRNKKKKT